MPNNPPPQPPVLLIHQPFNPTVPKSPIPQIPQFPKVRVQKKNGGKCDHFPSWPNIEFKCKKWPILASPIPNHTLMALIRTFYLKGSFVLIEILKR